LRPAIIGRKALPFNVDPQTWLADLLARIAEHPVHRLDDLLPWNWRDRNKRVDQAA
jgi:hypothetical protein